MNDEIPTNTGNEPDAAETPQAAAAEPADVDALRDERDALVASLDAALSEAIGWIPESMRGLIPEELPPAERLLYVLRNREALGEPAEAQPAFGAEKASPAGRIDRPWEDLTGDEKVRLAKERPGQFRRARETYLQRSIVATR